MVLLLSSPVQPGSEGTCSMGMGESRQALYSLLLEGSLLMHSAAPGCKGPPQAALQEAAYAVRHGVTLCMLVGNQVLPAGKGLCLRGNTRK